MRDARHWRWTEREVRLTSDHFELSFGDLRQADCCKPTAVALVGRPTKRTFPVRWLLDLDQNTAVGEGQKMLFEARRQLDFYLVEHPRQFRELMGDPWSYAIYHCGTAANLYSLVHWSYFPRTAPPQHLDAAKPSGAEEMMMRITTGRELASSLRHGDHVQIEQGNAKVHQAYADKETGRPRICRPALFDVKRDRSWRVDASTLPGEPCEACDNWR